MCINIYTYKHNNAAGNKVKRTWRRKKIKYICSFVNSSITWHFFFLLLLWCTLSCSVAFIISACIFYDDDMNFLFKITFRCLYVLRDSFLISLFIYLFIVNNWIFLFILKAKSVFLLWDNKILIIFSWSVRWYVSVSLIFFSYSFAITYFER